ncbi:MAG: VOC family protein [Candidatus Anstonellales archaeon]
MRNDKNLISTLGLPPPSQIGIVVRDMKKAVEYYTSIFGIGPFLTYEFIPEKHWYMEEPSYLKLMMGKAMWGNFELELIQPLEGKSFHKEFLEKYGEGIQHLGFNISNYDEMFEKFKSAGFKPVMRAETYIEIYKGFLRATYFDTRHITGIMFEIIWKSWLKEKF